MMNRMHVTMAQILRSHQISASRIPNGVKMLLYLGVIRNRMISTHKSNKKIREYYRLLSLDEGCSADDVRESFRKLAKKYHPDSGSSTADSATFVRIEEAYRKVLSHVVEQSHARQNKVEEMEEEEEKFKYNTPQHRHYLSFEGIGFGTPSQREKQYRQFRADRATEQVMEYRKQKLQSQHFTNSVTVKDVRQSKEQKITQAIERLVEDLIQESMAKGDFDNLSGKGKPLKKFSGCSYIDPMTHNLNRILIDNGYQPEWILMQKEIKDTIEQLREAILVSRKKLGNPMTPAEQKQWNQVCEQFQENIRKLNKRINDFNLIVPILARQKVHFDAQKEIIRTQKIYETLIKTKEDADKSPNDINQEEEKTPGVKTGLLNWMNLWKFIKI
ncbi:dnaJ homolog subfamily C member 28 [Ictidomys tridecemlineatus]|uniref:DnaJ heat shock protein family (Hsp40) member C28 n=1 Tax=Ictidomys tridecemlineatus TaxID=43179 RepID=I3MZF8_ICTTR|nr:dnaJ homolog subfamily C member 28 [Ictidomys tridecemlineatus]XP_013213279.1 dnaJ homolog subfamily C member 28 [Ictidomys tridecemlineatus]XP_040142928.1 dnaJ homolog subfamily C member 28 [Ictidomys tridecemlineatus]KAG3283902.1 DnaJ heat shock protein family (Hsp40) member C28, transcript variant X2 [Ictidomys tridecemlineatus]KAG3283903.1 DnaJ heat shock protein family (Hsp40) member C28, transcript variant X1 [Ictidomys tridecemlineatus]